MFSHEHVCERQVQRPSLYNLCPGQDSRQLAVPYQGRKKQRWVGPSGYDKDDDDDDDDDDDTQSSGIILVVCRIRSKVHQLTSPTTYSS